MKHNIDIGDGSSVEILNEFCYLVDMLSVDGDAEFVVTTSIRSGWFDFKLRPLASSRAARSYNFNSDSNAVSCCRFLMPAHQFNLD